jgi:hypothetical protein
MVSPSHSPWFHGPNKIMYLYYEECRFCCSSCSQCQSTTCSHNWFDRL